MFVLAPIYYMVLISFRSPNEYLSANAWLPTGGLSLSSYSSIFHSPGVGTDFRNSVELAVGHDRGGRYAFPRRWVPDRAPRLPLAAVSFRVILFGIAIPIQAIIIPLYFITNKIHTYDTLYGLVLVLSASLIPVAVLLMVNYLRLIPRQLYDAMAVDGAGPWTTFTHLVVPMARPVSGCYQHLLRVWAPGITSSCPSYSRSPIMTRCCRLGMYQFASNGEYALNVPVLMAFVMLSALPLLILYIGLRRQFVKGIGGFALR